MLYNSYYIALDPNMCGLLMKFVVKFKIVFIVDFHILLVFVIIV